MFIFDGARTRAAALTLALVTAIPLFPRANATERPRATLAEGVDSKAPKKLKKKKSSDAHHKHAVRARLDWNGHPRGVWSAAAKKAQRDPIKVVLATARAQLGKPYRWAATGPSSFDCSGFTMYAWRAAGISLPHNSSAQNAATKDVPLDKLRPGDLIFAPGHVGMYVGHGKMIHSPHTGDHVKISPVHSNAYVGGRPI
jgi:peptidoglycan DL-endopeptidase CwlO